MILIVLLAVLLGATLLWVGAQGTPIDVIDTTPGQAVFNANCVACHQATGSGLPTIFPPLKGHVPELLVAEGGKDYILRVVLFGLTGAISVGDTNYDGLMPAWGHLSDAQLADVLNYLATAWDNVGMLPEGFVAFSAEDVLHARGAALDSHGVYLVRETLGLD